MHTDKNPYELKQIASVENPVYESWRGRYFIGQSRLLSFGFEGYAYGVLYNPVNSGVDLYVSVVTVTNTSDWAIKSRLYVNPRIPDGVFEVREVAPADLALSPLPKPKVKFLAGEFITEEITGGMKLFTRMVPPKQTLANEKNGKIVIPPGGNLTTVLVPPGPDIIKADVAYGWWEA